MKKKITRRRRHVRIDGRWRVRLGSKIPSEGRRLAFWLYALARSSHDQVFHKRSIVRELWMIGLRTRENGIFSERDMENDSNIHATFDNMYKDGVFKLVEDLGERA